PDPMSLSPGQCDESIVKMEWSKQFERCRKDFEVAESRLNTANADNRLKELLKDAGWRDHIDCQLGSNTMSARQMDAGSQV
ncbi:DUF6402 family protein, partial [Pseudomonas syringae group genomosp. 7]|uniref:DUF6402 family protein n=1 Tax=Pseudomonas syringae group genomosp. 7 TaxID=251699 RepID=UPI0037703420